MNKKLLFGILALVLVVATLLGVYFATRPQAQQGEKEITVTVVHKDKTELVKTLKTDAEFLAQAMLEAQLIPEGNIQNGMFDTVDGETAVWSEDEGWWGIYQGDTMASVGINDLTVADGDSFRFVYINGFAS